MAMVRALRVVLDVLFALVALYCFVVGVLAWGRTEFHFLATLLEFAVGAFFSYAARYQIKAALGSRPDNEKP
jgi:hypothetical protein